VQRSQAKNDWQLTVYIPKTLRGEDPIMQLKHLALSKRRSVNFLVVEAIRKYVQEMQHQNPLEQG